MKIFNTAYGYILSSGECTFEEAEDMAEQVWVKGLTLLNSEEDIIKEYSGIKIVERP